MNASDDRVVHLAKGLEGQEDLRAKANREELVSRIARAVPQDGIFQLLPGLDLARVSSFSGPTHGISFPSFCVIAQGSKDVYLGQERFHYDPYHYLLSTVELPVVIQQIEASPERPHFSFRLALDPALVASVMLEAGMPAPRNKGGSTRAIDVSPLGTDLLDASLRLVRLLDASPAEVRVLQPLITREIVLRLLVGEQRERLRHVTVPGGHTERIISAIQRLSKEFDRPLNIEDLARELGMSPSGFHGHFKAVTAMSPLQFQKHLRLQEARRLMLGEDLDAASAGFRVGYEDTSQFSREYKRQFGQPPRRDVQRLRMTSDIRS